MSDIVLEIMKCRSEAVLPRYARTGDAGMDLYSCADIELAPGETVLVPTGIKLSIPYGYEAQIRPRSGLSLNTKLRLPNSPGTIDCGYRDELMVIMCNASTGVALNDANDGYFLDVKGSPDGIYKIRKGDRIAQMIISKVEYAEINEVKEFYSDVENRGGGFGSSGTR